MFIKYSWCSSEVEFSKNGQQTGATLSINYLIKNSQLNCSLPMASRDFPHRQIAVYWLFFIRLFIGLYRQFVGRFWKIPPLLVGMQKCSAIWICLAFIWDSWRGEVWRPSNQIITFTLIWLFIFYLFILLSYCVSL